MKDLKSILCFWLMMWMFSCTGDPFESMPVVKLGDNENKQFTFTNKVSGYYLGNSHLENKSINHGWTVNNIRYLKDYRIYANNKLIQRDSLHQFNYYPFTIVREYGIPVKERFTLLDSVDAIVWEFNLSSELKDFSFEPVVNRKENETEKNILSSSSSQLIFSPQELCSGDSVQDIKWMGFLYLTTGKNTVIILCVLEASQYRLKYALEKLSINFDSRIDQRINRILSIVKTNNTITNIPEITEALAWAQLSLDALITQQERRGIWAGLPLFNHYRGRETFISFAGALLVNGKFGEAREILNSFSRFQLRDENDSWDGRIPHRVTDEEIVYNNADVTWWFIREVYEYYLYSADSAFVQEIFPVIKRAIQSAIRHRVDENFFLVHDNAETWMDTGGPDGAWSPRGNRAIEIQSLWYTTLQIGSLLAGLNDEKQLMEHWLTISHSLRKNINKKYWSRVKNRLYDHLNEDGFPDRKVRPNQIFAVFVPHLPDIEPLFENDRCAQITSNVVHKLTYRYGVASLWQEDEDFHPWYFHSTNYQQDEANHNGMVWSWLAGPVISSMMMFNRQELALNLFYDQAIQILQDDAIGNFAQLREALPRSGQSEPAISGTLSNARSLAEFSRNFYQDFLGYRPNAAKKSIIFNPKIPAEFGYISATLHFIDNQISFVYSAVETSITFEFSLKSGQNSVTIILEFPGFDPVHFSLDGENPSFVVSLNSKNQRSFHMYKDLEWYFAQPELITKIESESAAP